MYFNQDNSEQTRGAFLVPSALFRSVLPPQNSRLSGIGRDRIRWSSSPATVESGHTIDFPKSPRERQRPDEMLEAGSSFKQSCNSRIRSSYIINFLQSPRDPHRVALARFSRDQMRCSRLEVHPHRSRSEGSITLRPITYRVSKVHGKST